MWKSKNFQVVGSWGTASFSEMSITSLKTRPDVVEWIYTIVPEQHRSAPIYFFNRLFVPERERGKRVATALMKQVEEWADTEKIIIINTVNPYGGDKGPNLKQLVAFYRKYDFVEHKKHKGLMLRMFKT